MGQEMMLENVEYRLVGSVLTIDDPRDIDIVGVMPDSQFEAEFGISTQDFDEMLHFGNWNWQMQRWAKRSIETQRILDARIDSSISVDFRYIPESCYIRTQQ